MIPCESTPAAFTEARNVDDATRLRPLCARCPILAGCRDFALHHEVAGFAAGLTARQRRQLGAPYTVAA